MNFNLGNLSGPTFEILDLLPHPSPKNPVLVRGEGWNSKYEEFTWNYPKNRCQTALNHSKVMVSAVGETGLLFMEHTVSYKSTLHVSINFIMK